MAIRQCVWALSLIGLAVSGTVVADDRANEDLIKRYIEEIVNNGSDTAAREVLAVDFVRYGPGPILLRGSNALQARMREQRGAFPEFRVTIDEIAVDGDTAWCTARYAGATTSGARVEGSATSFYRFANGRITEHHLGLDMVGALRQQGLEPQPFWREHNRRLVSRALNELFNEGNLEIADELFASDHRFHGPGAAEGQPRGPQGVRERVTRNRDAFSDIQMNIEEIIGEGRFVAVRATMRGRHTGEFLGVAPTNQHIEISGLNLHRIESGKITETWIEWDTGKLLRQLAAGSARASTHSE